jgi:hypothetical protein
LSVTGILSAALLAGSSKDFGPLGMPPDEALEYVVKDPVGCFWNNRAGRGPTLHGHHVGRRVCEPSVPQVVKWRLPSGAYGLAEETSDSP